MVVRAADEGDATITVEVRPADGRREVQTGFKGSLDLEDVTRATLKVVTDTDIALSDMEIERAKAAHVETPTGILTRAEGVIDHVAGSEDAGFAKAVQGGGLQAENLVRPKDVDLVIAGSGEEIVIKALYVRANGEAEGNLAKERLRDLISIDVEGHNGMASPLKRPQTVESRVVRGEAAGVENLHDAGEVSDLSRQVYSVGKDIASFLYLAEVLPNDTLGVSSEKAQD